MDKTIRNLDPKAYREAKARAAVEGRTLGAVVSEAMAMYCARQMARPADGSVLDLVPRDLGEGTEDLSIRVDEVVYGG